MKEAETLQDLYPTLRNTVRTFMPSSLFYDDLLDELMEAYFYFALSKLGTDPKGREFLRKVLDELEEDSNA